MKATVLSIRRDSAWFEKNPKDTLYIIGQDINISDMYEDNEGWLHCYWSFASTPFNFSRDNVNFTAGMQIL
jgi:hypothetical protein